MEKINYTDDIVIKYNESLDLDTSVDDGGHPLIASIRFRRSEVLYELAYNTYKDGFDEFLERQYEEIRDDAYDNFPSIIAYNLRLSEKGEGADDPIKKLLHLKDTWESIIYTLYALVFGEIKDNNVKLAGIKLIHKTDINGMVIPEDFNSVKLLSDALRQKIHNINAVVSFSKNNGLNLKCECITESLLGNLGRLHDARNDISHHATPTIEEANRELSWIVTIFKNVIKEASFLSQCRICRFESFTTYCKCEIFNGHALNKEYEKLDFETAKIMAFGQDNIFCQWDGVIFSLSPFLHFHADVAGRESYLCVYKSKSERLYHFEPVSKRAEVNFPHLQPRFDQEKNNITQLIMP